MQLRLSVHIIYVLSYILLSNRHCREDETINGDLLNYRLIKFWIFQNIENLQRFLNFHSTAINSFKALNITYPLDCFILHISVRNLDHSTKKAFEKQCSSQNIPTYQSLTEFVNKSCKTQEWITPPSSQLMYKKKKLLYSVNNNYKTSRF